MAKQNTELVSVVIISLNKQEKLRDCLDSAFAQEYRNIEIIVIDNGSTPGTLEMLREYGGDLLLIENKVNLGACVARNQGIKAAKGKYILFLDDDVLLLDKDTVSRAVELLESNPQIGELGAIHYADKEKKRISLVQVITGYDGWTDIEKSTERITEISFNSKMIIPTCFAMIRKAVLESVGGFDPYFFYYEEDNDLSMRIKRKGYLVALDPEICIYHVAGTRPRSAINAARNKAYLILKSYSLGFKIAFAFTVVKKLLGAKSLGQLKDALLMLGFAFFYTVMYPLVWYRNRINFLEGGGSLDRFSFTRLDLFTKLMTSAVKKLRLFLHPSDKSLYLFVTNRCNAKCKHCFYWKHTNITGHEMSLDELKGVAKSIHREISGVAITGGEPFLRRDLVDICKEFLGNRRVKSFSLVTNGLLSEKIHNDVKEILNFSSPNVRILVTVSLDGFEKTHDKIRNTPDSFFKVVATIHKLKSLQKKHPNLEVSAVTTVMKDNHGQIEQLNRFVENDLGIYHRINLFRSARTDVFGVSRDLLSDFSSGRDSGLPLEMPELERICHYFLSKENWLEYHKMILRYSLEILRYRRKMFDCLAPQSNMVIYPNGDMSFCEFLKPVGNLRHNGFQFQKLWNAGESNALRKKLKNCVCTHPCNLGPNLMANPQLWGCS